MKKIISLRELNASGILIAECKFFGFSTSDSLTPCLFPKGDPSTCYLHYYKNAYIVTRHIISSVQREFHDLKSASDMFNSFAGHYSF